MKRQLHIIIAGDSGSGKSTLALLFEEFLEKKGFEVNMDIDNELFDYGSEEKFRGKYKDNVNKRLKSIKEKSIITISQKQIIARI